MSWQPLKNYENDYEINVIFPYQLRKISTGRILKEDVHGGYVRCTLNQKQKFKHVLIAEQWLEKQEGCTEVDHINRNKLDNRLENLRWVSISDNVKNRSKANGYTYEFINNLPEDAIEIITYKKHTFQNYYYSPNESKSYYKITDNSFRILPILTCKNSNYVTALDNDHKRTRMYLKTLDKLFQK